MASLPDLKVYKEAEKARVAQIESLKSKGVENVALTMVFQPIASGAMKAFAIEKAAILWASLLKTTKVSSTLTNLRYERYS